MIDSTGARYCTPTVRTALLTVASIALFVGASPLRAATPAQELANRFAPIVALKVQEKPCDHHGEPYRPTSVDIVLGNPAVTLRGPGRGHPVVTDAPTAADLYGKGSGYFLNFPGNPVRPGCRYERDGRKFASGFPSLAYAHIVTQPDRPGELALQYWFYYYFNDYNNKHESDWEGIQLVFDASTAAEALRTTPVEVGYAQHEGGERADWEGDKLERVGDHPVVYPGAGSHASYYSNALWLGASAEQGIGCDDTTPESRQVQLQAAVVPTRPQSAASPYAWLAFEGRWGQLAPGPDNGPTGPNTKARWTEPLAWQDELRSVSIRVPTGGTFGPSVTRAFCDGVSAVSDVLLFFGGRTWPLILLLVGAVAVAGAAGTRTTWRPHRRIPIRMRRALGQILRAAAVLYWRHKLVFVAIGAISVAISLASIGVQALLDVLLEKIDTQLVVPWGIVSVAIINAAAGVALDRLDRDERVTIPTVYRPVLRRFWPLMGASFLALLVLLLVFVAFAALPVGLSFVFEHRWVPYLALIGTPVAIWLAIRFAFIPYVVVLEGAGVRQSFRRSSALVKGTWWSTAITLGLLYVIAVSISTVVGWVLIFTTSLAPELFNLIGSAIYALVLPFVAISACLLYFDRKERERERAERAADSESLTLDSGADGLRDPGGASGDPGSRS